MMKTNVRKLALTAAGAAALFCLSVAPRVAAQDGGSAADAQTVAAFEARAKAYSKLREDLEDTLPKLPKEATPEQIAAHKKTFQGMVMSARAGAKHGDVLTPDIAAVIRAMLKREYRGKELAELRQTVMEAETKGVPLRVNTPYPENKELVEMPPTLLLRLPQLPKQLRYRFVGTNLLLVDRENGLIVDYMTRALP
ncbi:MAG TPA: hypothetical protein VG148_18725 [Pyrinomonadaceae bacterium]|nr:hypothetical protein [Pyrinomonadaceae bacterium]